MPFTTRDTVKLYWQEVGNPQGVPIILLHGLFMTHRIWDRVAKYLPQYRLILLDLHGHGQSSRPLEESAYSWEEMNADITAVLDALALEKTVLGGLSLGANVSLTFAQAFPERVLALLLEMPVLTQSEHFARFLFTNLAEFLHRSKPVLHPFTRILEALPRMTLVPELALLHDIAGINIDAAHALIYGFLPGHFPPDEPKDLTMLTMPTLVLGHHIDALHAWDDAELLAKRLPCAELAEMYTSLDLRLQPKHYAERIDDFLIRHGIDPQA